MKRRMLGARYPLLALFLVTLAALGLFLFAGPSHGAIAGAPAVPPPQVQKPDNSACLACHSQPGLTGTFLHGDVLGVSIDATVYDQSQHTTLACTTCHPNISLTAHPNKDNIIPVTDARTYTLQYKDTCTQCHPDQSAQLAESTHTQLRNTLPATDPNRNNLPICADCHNPHSQAKIQLDANGQPAPSEHAAVAQICAKCHNAIYQQFLTSVHGSAIINNANPDVPSCTDCHGVHAVQGPDSPGFRINSPTQVCGKCHTDPQRMAKYGISTQVLNTYVADFHGTTVTLFQKIDPEGATNKPVCYDCHGVHNISNVNDPQTGLAIKQNMLAVCQRCHPDATTNFPASWLSHYIPSPTEYPLVYYVNLFYIILIPTVIGAMVIYVGTDVYRRNIFDRRHKGNKSGDESGPAPSGEGKKG